MPVPTHNPEVPGSHAHSPRRKPLFSRDLWSQRFPAPGMSSGGVANNPTVRMPYYGRGNAGTGIVVDYVDPFTEPEPPFDWPTSMAKEDAAKPRDGRHCWPGSLFRPNGQSSSDVSMPDYQPSRSSDPAQASNPSLEEEPTRPRAPNPRNTPAAGVEQAFLSTQGTDFELLSDPAALSPNLGPSLTHSLLNQPFSLPVPHRKLIFPSSEPKARKEIRHAPLAHTSSFIQSITPHADVAKSAKAQHPLFSLGEGDMAAAVSTPSHASAESQDDDLATPQAVFPASSRRDSSGDCSSNITDAIYGSDAEPAPNASTVGTSAINASCPAGALDVIGALNNHSSDNNTAATHTERLPLLP